jgi:hypothetical protein
MIPSLLPAVNPPPHIHASFQRPSEGILHWCLNNAPRLPIRDLLAEALVAVDAAEAEAGDVEQAARAADLLEELDAFEHRAAGAARRLGAGLYPCPSARGSIRSMAFA